MMHSLETGGPETIRSRLEAMLEELSAGPGLSVSEALTQVNEIVEQFGDDALALEEKGQFEEAAALYERLTNFFELAAQKVAEEEDRQRVASLGDYWSLKARRARITPEPTAKPTPHLPPYIKQWGDSIADRPSLKRQREGLALASDKFKPPAGAFKKPGEIPDRRWPVVGPPRLTGGSKPLAVAPKKPAEVLGRRWPVARSPWLTGVPRPPAAALKKPDEVLGGRRLGSQSPPFVDESKPSALTKLRQALGLKKPDKA